MVNSTSNHGFQLWEDGEEPWEHRSDFKDLDTKLVIKDVKSNRPSASTSGQWFLATDEPALYYDDGEAWNHVGGRNLQTNDLENVDDIVFSSTGTREIQLPNTSGTDVTVRDQNNSQDVARFLEGGNIEAPNGSFKLGSTNSAVSTLWADSGDLVFLGSSGSGTGGNTTTSTTYTDVLGTAGSGAVPAGKSKPTNISEYYISGVALVRNDTSNETTSVRVKDDTNSTNLSGTEVEVTSTTFEVVHTPIVSHDPGDDWKFDWQMKVTSGTGELHGNPTIQLWGQVA